MLIVWRILRACPQHTLVNTCRIKYSRTKGLTTLATIITPEDGTDHKVDLFLAGGITNCPDWQTEVTHMLTHLDINIANPRRPYGLEKTGDEAARQISWEHEMLDRAAVTMFWFPAGATQPIALLELGRKMTQERPALTPTMSGHSMCGSNSGWSGERNPTTTCQTRPWRRRRRATG